MKNFASGNGRCEFGFYIYYNRTPILIHMEKLFEGLSFKYIKKKIQMLAWGKSLIIRQSVLFFIAIRLCGITLKKQ